MKTVTCILALIVLIQSEYAQEKPMQALRVVPSIDLQKYAGTWYEIARLPNSFQNDCAGDVTATYTLDGNESKLLADPF